MKKDYKMLEGNYEDYKVIYGLKYSNSKQGEDVKSGQAKFYIIKDGDDYINDFVIYLNDDNWITLDNRDYYNIDYINFVFENLKKFDYKYITFLINNQMEKELIDFIKNNYTELTYENVIETEYEYTKFKKTF